MKPVVRVVWISRANVFLLIFLGAKLKFTMAGEKFSVCEMTSKCYAGRRFFDRDMPALQRYCPRQTPGRNVFARPEMDMHV